MSRQPATENNDRIRMIVMFGAIGLIMIAGFGVLAWSASSTQTGGAAVTDSRPGQGGPAGNASPGSGDGGGSGGGAANGPGGVATKPHNYTDWVGNAPAAGPRPGAGGLQGPNGPPGHLAGD